MMRKIFVVVFITVIFLGSGCGLLENAAGDVGGWDVSACVSGFSTCWELFTDNADKFEDGFVSAMGGL